MSKYHVLCYVTNVRQTINSIFYYCFFGKQHLASIGYLRTDTLFFVHDITIKEIITEPNCLRWFDMVKKSRDIFTFKIILQITLGYITIVQVHHSIRKTAFIS